jgi:hypothetical protein
VTHRVATSGHYRDGLADIEERWTLEMLVDAYDVCDAYDDAAAEAAERR